ncbi:MAG TPA: hypothetical protein VGC17_02425 [Lactovum miscens]|uniref:hypothetical protein n=1 Tax=Lactovum miscens TaxID=190387 RepID=UPI002ED7B5F3
MNKILIESQVGMEVYSEFFHEDIETDQDQEFWSNIGTGKYNLSYLINAEGPVNYEYDTLESLYGEGFDIDKLQKKFTQVLNEKRLEFGLEKVSPERKIDVNIDDLAELSKDNPKALEPLSRGNLPQEVSSNYDLKSVGLDDKHFDSLLEETAFYQDLNTQFLHEFKEWPDIFSASQYESLKEETRKQILGSQEGLQQAIYEATEAKGSIDQISDYAKDILTEVNNYKVLEENLERLLQENIVFINNIAPPKIQPLNKFEERLAQTENSKNKENPKQNFSLKTGFHV